MEGVEGPLFLALDAHRTGIDFTFSWDPPEAYKWLFDNMVGGGVAIGDYDNDGWPDIYFTRAFGGSRLFRNLGDFRFEDVTESAGLDDGGAWGMGASFADVDNDGDLDLFVCGYDFANRLYENQGDGTFAERAQTAGLDFKGASIMMAFADYDRDGDLDGYLLTNRYIPPTGKIIEADLIKRDGQLVVPEEISDLIEIIEKPNGRRKAIKIGQEDKFYRNEGDGTFTDVTGETGIGGRDMGLGVIWWDFDHDGWPDLYVSNDFYGADKLYQNNRDGTFTDVIRETIPHTPWFSMGADVADINNDGLLDLMASDMAATTHYKSKVNMGDMGEQTWFLTYADPPQYMANALYLNSGTSRFLEVSRLLGLGNTDWTWSVKFADFDNDGWSDLFITNGMTRNWFNSDMRAKVRALGGLATEEGGRIFLDAPRLEEANLAFRNLGDLNFQNIGDSWGLGHTGVSFGAATGDLDGDGDLDLVVNNFEEPVSLYRNQSSAGNRVVIRLVGKASNRFGVGSMVRVKTKSGTQVRYLTLARGFASADQPVLHFGFGDDDFIDHLSVEWPGGRTQSFLNLPVNRFYTITEPEDAPVREDQGEDPPAMFAKVDRFSGIVHREDPYEDFQDQPLLPHKMSRLGPGMAWGDIDGDGDSDFFIGGASGQPGMLFEFEEEGSFPIRRSEEAFLGDAQREDMGALFFDVDSDGDNDLYVVSGGPGRWAFDSRLSDRLYLNDGKGNFTRAPPDSLPKNHQSGSVVAGADFDRDGDVDLFVGGRYLPRQYPVAAVSRLLRNEGGRFQEVTDKVANGLGKTGLVTSAVWSDADGDGWVDLLVTHEWGPVKIFMNEEGRLKEYTDEAGLGDLLGWWNGIAARDIDNDGDIDYAVTNFGLNTKYKASREKPAVLYYGDFGLQKRMHLVEGEYENETLYPVRGRSCSTSAIPQLAAKFETFHDFALAPLEEIYTGRRLQAAQRFEANVLSSGLLINDGDGHFDFQPLPRIAQAAPGFGIVLTEVNGDGNADIYLVQNFYGPQPETGRMDGGVSLLLTGRGDGTFQPVWPNRSGLVVPGDAKALTAMDLNNDGWVDFVVTRNDGEAIFFQNRGSSTSHVFSLRLRGKPGNLDAVGSRVTLKLEDGSRQTAEICLGNGYLSQSSATLFFGLGERGRVVTIDITWPDGQVTSQQLVGSERNLIIQQPES